MPLECFPEAERFYGPAIDPYWDMISIKMVFEWWEKRSVAALSSSLTGLQCHALPLSGFLLSAIGKYQLDRVCHVYILPRSVPWSHWVATIFLTVSPGPHVNVWPLSVMSLQWLCCLLLEIMSVFLRCTGLDKSISVQCLMTVRTRSQSQVDLADLQGQGYPCLPCQVSINFLHKFNLAQHHFVCKISSCG